MNSILANSLRLILGHSVCFILASTKSCLMYYISVCYNLHSLIFFSLNSHMYFNRNIMLFIDLHAYACQWFFNSFPSFSSVLIPFHSWRILLSISCSIVQLAANTVIYLLCLFSASFQRYSCCCNLDIIF